MAERKETTLATGKEVAASLPAVALVFPGIDSNSTDLVKAKGLKEAGGQNEGIFYRLNDNRRGIAEVLGIEPQEVIGRGVVYGRVVGESEQTLQIMPIVYRRVSSNILHTGYEDVIVEVSKEDINEERIRIASVEGNTFSDLEDQMRDTASPQSRHPSQSFTPGSFLGGK